MNYIVCNFCNENGHTGCQCPYTTVQYMDSVLFEIILTSDNILSPTHIRNLILRYLISLSLDHHFLIRKYALHKNIYHEDLSKCIDNIIEHTNQYIEYIKNMCIINSYQKTRKCNKNGREYNINIL